MARPRLLPSAEYLHQCFIYKPRLGTLTWKHRPLAHFKSYNSWAQWNGRYATTLAGCSNTECVNVTINNVSYKAHRIIWKMVHKNDPHHTIDHINRNPLINKIANLRDANDTEQQWNKRVSKNNTSGARGVRSTGNGKWGAQIREHNRYRWLGSFNTVAEASNAYEAAVKLRY